MRRYTAKQIAEVITNEQLKEMFDRAKASIKDWTKVSSVNKGITKGVAWNILAEDFDVNADYHILAKINMIREFGEYLSEKSSPEKRVKPKSPIHQVPRFLEESKDNH